METPIRDSRAGFLLIAFSALFPAGVAVAGSGTTLPGRATVPVSKAAITIRAGGGPLNTFVPESTFGAGVDGRELGDARRTFTQHNLKAMRSAGFGPLTYRLRTELGIEAWHWNPKGQWSDAGHKQGYWTSAPSSGPLPESFGYRLPRRGSTTDQANNDGYSRIDDGDHATYWKSNPYLDEAFTHESNDNHPQWIAIDFGKARPVNAIRISWGEPFATHYSVEYCSADQPAGDFTDGVPQCWVPFPDSAFTTRSARRRIDVLARHPVRTRFIRILLTQSCRCLARSTPDIRDRVGYSIREIEAGVVDGGSRFHDAIRHARNHKQTEIVASSTDPWHSEADIDRRTEQPGFDRVFASGLTNGQPMLVPAGVLYDSPANAAGEVQYLLSRGYPVTQVELGEEPDGQYTTPEDYGALFIQVADASHRIAPAVQVGGPSFQTSTSEYFTMPLHGDKRTWLRRFIDYLTQRGQLRDYGFFSFEWYPFDNGCGDTASQLIAHPAILRGVLERLKRDGLSRDIPWFISEYGYSAFANRPEVDMEGAMLNAETVALFLTLGGTRAYLYGFEPNSLMDELSCNSWGNNAMFLAGDEGQSFASTAIYWAARLINEQWVQPGKLPHQIYAADADVPVISAYAIRRPDRKWSVLVINKDPHQAYALSFTPLPRGDIETYRYSRDQYVWKANGAHGRPSTNAPPRYDSVPAGDSITVPPFSVSIVRFAE